ncbi:MAG: phosphoglycerate mutase family protein [Candidatus Micrarchaeota archaeon]
MMPGTHIINSGVKARDMVRKACIRAGKIEGLQKKIQKKLFIFRHGAYDRSNGRLLPESNVPVIAAARQIAKGIRGKRVALITSPVPRTKQTAAIIAVSLGLAKINERKQLLETTELPELKKLLASIKRSKEEVIIVVTHAPQIKLLSQMLGHKKVLLDYGSFLEIKL